MTTVRDWREAVACLREAHGPPTAAQGILAARLGVELSGFEPRGVAAATLRDTVAVPLGWNQPEPATQRQIEYLAALRPDDASQPWLPELTRGTASAWISYFLAQGTIAALEALEPCRGDLVLYRRRVYEPWLLEPDEQELREETHVVSSISDSGRVNFKRIHHSATGLSGAARSAWPTQLEIIARADTAGEPSSPRLPAALVPDTAAPRRPPPGKRAKARSLSVLKLWGRALVKLRHDPHLGLLWASLTRADLHGAPTEDSDAAEVVDALRTSAPDAEVLVLLRELADGVAITACSSHGSEIDELLPQAGAIRRGEIIQFGVPGSLEGIEQSLIDRMRDVQRRRQP